MDVVTTLDHLFDQVFASKPKEKRAAWLKILNAEEYETVEDLRLASDEAWASLQLPLAIKDSLKNALKAPSKPPVPQPLIKSKPVDTRPIAQLDVIVFDISSSMNSKSFDPLNTRLGLAKTLFHSMVDKYIGYELAHSLSLVLFGQETRCFPFTRDYETFHDTMGNAPADENATKLWDSVYVAGQQLIGYRDANKSLLSSDCKARIFCLTDGEDNASSRPVWQVAKFLQDNNIILDSIPLATSNMKLQSLALATGGYCLKVIDAERGVELFEREAVISVIARETNSNPLPTINSENDLNMLTQKAKDSVLESVDDIKQALPQAVNSTVLTVDSILKLQSTAPSASSSTKRLLKELKDGPPPGVQYFVTDADMLSWKIILEGPLGTPYYGGTFLIFLNFPTDYPFKPPRLQFITPIYHCNVSNDGKVCMDILRDQWSPAITISKLMLTILELLANPNPLDALDTVKANVYSDNKETYFKNAIEHCKRHASENTEELKKRYNFYNNATTNQQPK